LPPIGVSREPPLEFWAVDLVASGAGEGIDQFDAPGLL
jgi:hypothetical protein